MENKMDTLEDLVRIIRILRGENGCPWDRVQTHASIRMDMLEEAYEAADAIDKKDMKNLCEELGDVLMQVVFHAEIETEQGGFTMGDVIQGICEKMIYRHPHVFGSGKADTGLCTYPCHRLPQYSLRRYALAVQKSVLMPCNGLRLPAQQRFSYRRRVQYQLLMRLLLHKPFYPPDYQ